MFNFFKKKSIQQQVIVYVRNSIPVKDIDIVSITILLINSSNLLDDLNYEEPYITQKQYDLLTKHELEKYFSPILIKRN